MSREPAGRLCRALVGCYPPRWQQRYREEILDVLDQHQASARTVLSLAGGALATEVGGEPTTAVVTLWSLEPGRLRRLSAFEGGITVAIAPDGRLVATSAFGGQAALWNVARPRHPVRLSVLSAGSSNALWGEAFSPDSKLLAAAYGGGGALWDIAHPGRPRLLTVLNAHVGQVTTSDIAFSPDGHLLALASGNGQVTIWNAIRPAHGYLVATMSGPRRAGWFTALKFAPSGQFLAGVTATPVPCRRLSPQPGTGGCGSRGRRP